MNGWEVTNLGRVRRIEFARASQKDQRQIPPNRRREIADDLRKLAAGQRESLDIKPIEALNKEWSRLRVGSYRVVFREVGDDVIQVARVVPRQELEDAIRRMRR